MGRTGRFKRGVVTNMVGAELVPKIIPAYEFDGVSMYATFPDWRALGSTNDVRLVAMPLSDNFAAGATLVGESTLQARSISINFGPELRSVWRDVDDLDSNAYTSPIEKGVSIRLHEKNELELHSLSNKGVTGTDQATFGAMNPANDLNILASRQGTDRFFQGPMRNLTLTDNAPLQNTDILVGTGSRYIHFPDFFVGDGEHLRITFDYIRQDVGASTANLIGSIPTNGIVSMNDTDNVTPNRISLRNDAGVARYVDNAMEDVANGQHCTVVVERNASNVMSVTVDGVNKGNGNATLVGSITFNEIGRSVTSWPAGAAIGNVVLENLTTGEYVEYRIDEGSGTTVKAYDSAGNEVPASSGTIAPDADWQFISDNSRHYPMNEGEGNTFYCYDGTGKRRPEYDATIQNFSEDNWKLWP